MPDRDDPTPKKASDVDETTEPQEGDPITRYARPDPRHDAHSANRGNAGANMTDAGVPDQARAGDPSNRESTDKVEPGSS